MKRLLSLLCVATLALSASAQTLGECQTAGPVPAIGGVGDCEGLTGFAAQIVAAGSCAAMPSEGLQFARITAGATPMLLAQNAPAGTNIVRPIPAGQAELRIPLTSGFYSITLDYSWFNSEGGSAQWTDGFDISVCDSSGNLVAIIAAAHGAANSGCSGVTSVTSSAINVPGGGYLSCVCFNGGDSCCAPGSYLEIDNVSALVASPPFTLAVTSPGGAGSLQTNLTNGAPFGLFFMGVALSPGAFPNGVFYGIDLSLFDVLQQASLGVPFLGGLDGGGGYQFGPIGGVPSGLTFYAVALDNILSINPAVSAAVSHTVP